MEPQLQVKRNLYMNTPPQIERSIVGCIDIENIKFAQNIQDVNVHFDLNHLYNECISKPDIVDPKLDSLLKFLQDHESILNFDSPQILDDSLYFCYRGLMTTVCSTPFEQKEPWKIAVILFKGNIYLCQRNTEEKLKRLLATTEEERRNIASGHKFEQFIFSDTPDTEPNPNEPCNEFNSIFRLKLGKHTTVFGAEMDGVACDNSDVKLPPKDATYHEIIDYLQQLEFVEAKTNLQFYKNMPWILRSFGQYKSGKWWCQSFLVGINRIICGFKNKNRIVESLKVFTLDEIRNMSQWDTNICLNFLDAFFSYVKQCLAFVIKRKFGSQSLNNIQKLGMVTLLLEWQPGLPVRMSQNWNHAKDVILPESFVKSFGSRVKVDNDTSDDTKKSKADEHSRDNENSYGHSSYRNNRGRFSNRYGDETQHSRDNENSYGGPSNRSNRGRFLNRYHDETQHSRDNENSYGGPSNRNNRGRFLNRYHDETRHSRDNENSYGYSSNSNDRGRFSNRYGDETQHSRDNENSYGGPSNRNNRGRFLNIYHDETQHSRDNENSYGGPSNRNNRGRFLNRYHDETQHSRDNENSYGGPSNRNNRGRFLNRYHDETQHSRDNENSYGYSSNRNFRGRFSNRYGDETQHSRHNENSYGGPSNRNNRGRF